MVIKILDCVSLKQQRIEIQKLRQGDNLILGFSIGGGIDQDPGQNPFSEDKTDKVITYYTIFVCKFISHFIIIIDRIYCLCIIISLHNFKS